MPKWKSALIEIALVAMPAGAQAETEPTASRLAAAQQVVAAVLPAEQRDAMMDQMMAAMLANISAGIKQRADVQATFEDPRVSKVFDRFLDRVRVDATAQLKSEMPKLAEAMARAYARRFSETQLSEMKVFFESPMGQAYIRESMGIMSDPDVAAWQRESMAKSFERMPQQLDELKRELEEALADKQA